MSQSVRDKLAAPAEAAVDLERIYTTAREMTRALDEIVWAVNPHHDTLDSLANYFGKFAQDYLAAAGIRCRLDIPMHLPTWQLTSEARHNLFLAFKEALNNSAQHASASGVRISLARGHAAFELVLADDGRGFALAPVGNAPDQPPMSPRAAGGNGLLNMQQGIAEIGGGCIIESAPGKSTGARFVVLRKGPKFE